MRVSSGRSRWAAIGAAVAVALGAGGLGLAGAATPAANPVTTLITPCRLMDTRSGVTNVGPRNTPIGAGESYTATVRGTNGQCTIPATATGIVANVTIVGPTAVSYLTVWPSDKTLPTSSNLNWVAGQAPTANQVTTALSVADGKIKLFNAAGTVNLIVDITGYLNPADLGNYYTKAQVDAAVAAAAACRGYPRTGVDWHGCNLTAANLTGANLNSANLNNADLNNVNLENAFLIGANLTGANLTGANLTGANLVGATGMGTATLTNVTWSFTVCPDGTFSNNQSGTCVGHL